MARIFILSCEMMNSLDMQKLKEDMAAVSRETFKDQTRAAGPLARAHPKVKEEESGQIDWDDANFDDFLDLENSIFEKVGIEKSTRSRLIECIATAREMRRDREPHLATRARVPLPKREAKYEEASEADDLIGKMEEFKAEVCRLARVTFSKLLQAAEEINMEEKRMTWRAKVINVAYSTMGAGVSVINIGAGIAGFMSADTAAYSATAGATLLSFRK